MNKLILTLLLPLIFTSHVFAQTTASSSAEAATDVVKEKLKERLEKTLAENPVPKRTRWYGMFGTITSKTGESAFKLTKSDETTATILINEETQLSFFKSGAPTRKIKVADIQQDWFAIAMGTEMQDNQTLTASRINFSAPLAAMPKRSVVYGKVTEIDDAGITLTNGKTTKITLPRKYEIKIKGVDKPTLDDININDKAVAVVEDLVDATTVSQSLKTVYVIPSNTNPRSANNQINEATGTARSRVATPSASVKPTATPKTTPKPTARP